MFCVQHRKLYDNTKGAKITIFALSNLLRNTAITCDNNWAPLFNDEQR